MRASGAGLQLVVAGYTITYAVLLVTGARLGDILGHRRVFLAGLVLFTLASLGCGLAGTARLLIVLRFVQGAGAALMIPQVLSLIQRTHAGQDRAMSRYSAVLAGGAVLNVLRLLGIIFQRFAQLVDSSVQPVFKVYKGVIRPKPASKFLPRHDITRVLRQHGQDFTRLFLQPDRESAPVEFTGLNIQFKGSDLDLSERG